MSKQTYLTNLDRGRANADEQRMGYQWIHTLETERKRLQTIIDKLDKTADCVPIVPGMVVWPEARFFVENESGATVMFCVKDNATGELMEPFDESVGWMPKAVFSTREASEAARPKGSR